MARSVQSCLVHTNGPAGDSRQKYKNPRAEYVKKDYIKAVRDLLDYENRDHQRLLQVQLGVMDAF